MIRKSKPYALIVDDEPDLRELLEITLGRMKINTESASCVSEAKDLLTRHDYSLCLSDLRLPDGTGIELLSYIQETFPSLPVAILTAHGTMEIAIEALKKGAFDFILKPIDLDDLRNLVNTAITASHDAPSPQTTDHLLLGESDVMVALKKKILKLACSQAPIYIKGPSGAGKELVARLIHESGPRRKQPFIPVNCGAIPRDLMESEFFGHKKGSFTGALQDKIGLFQAANHGTLFLDEVSELPLEMQVKLLRAIQEKAVREIGANKETKVDIRILSATNKDLRQLVAHGSFRDDLFYRINVINLDVPSLKERTKDIIPLAEHILNKLCHDSKVSPPTLSKGAISALESYDFPGNVRELENILERALTLSDNNRIETDDLQLQTDLIETSQAKGVQPFDSDEDNLESYLDNIEKETILNALEACKWNKTQTAKHLGISLRTLRYRLKKLDLDDD